MRTNRYRLTRYFRDAQPVTELYDHKTIIYYKGSTYTGCGAVINTDGGIDGNWLLVSIEGEGKIWNEQPFLTIDLASEKFYGNSGCNNISGLLRLHGGKICFTDINSSRSICANEDNSFVDAIVKCNGYTINNGILELTKDGKAILKFQRD